MPSWARACSSCDHLGWAIWNWIDWGNDFYIVTSQRVIWLEKVIGLYDSRQEAPLSTVLSVGVETDMMGRMLDYGDVVVRTYVGKIVFRNVAHPFEAARLVEEHWSRSKRSASHAGTRGHAQRAAAQDGTARDPHHEGRARRRGNQRHALALPALDPACDRREVVQPARRGGRQHHLPQALVRAAAADLAADARWCCCILGGMLARARSAWRKRPGCGSSIAARTPPLDTTMLVLPTLLIPVIFWWIYQYLDWRNDIFVVTSDQILDIDKKPFGSETRRAAPLENILSTEAERVGLAGYLLNFGTVYITIGGASLDFQDVQDPERGPGRYRSPARDARWPRNAKWKRLPSANACPTG